MLKITGHHHISMITKNAHENHQFYHHILGLRRVKKTVNQDDPSMYHLFYGDLTGSPGTGLTFFELAHAGRTHRGTDAITRIGLLIPSFDSLMYWENRLDEFQIEHSEITTYGDTDAIYFEDPDGLRLVLLNNQDKPIPQEWTKWQDSSVEMAHQILGMGPVELTVSSLENAAKTIVQLFGYKERSKTETEAVFQVEEDQLQGQIIIVEQEGPKEKPGRGSVHHLAIRVNDKEELEQWEQRIKDFGFPIIKKADRYYFSSIYMKETHGIIVELATDGPGFTVDTAVEDLGTRLDLPPFLEERRQEIEEKLTPIE
ncbi:VOC family protein [Lysinibacillus sp. FSL M8-0216]|uniref:VOC family protein n=1 Tax=Lysinibacillus TaxID=400634 RepID=UPI001EF5E592|nr:VOC family protein [Lysinibacillus fusiformis]MCG7435928.1 VOC family protein [Lysinibacillus fusiformis]